MTTETLTLSEFLLARIAEDEADFDMPRWRCTDSARGEGWGTRGDCPICDAYMFDGTEVVTEEAMYEHFDRVHRRERVLAECEANRRIVDLLAAKAKTDLWQLPDGMILLLLALPYADHPAYREEWRP
jgi:hypothetical protein